MKTMRGLFALAIAGAVAGAVAAPPAAADAVEDFYKRKRLTMYIGYSAGGGYDVYARTLARHMGRHIPGKPRFVAKNRPGAGSIILANEMYATLPQDGTVLATIGRGVPMEPLFGNAQAKFDPRKYGWIGSANNEVSVCAAMKKTGIASFEDMRTRGMIVGGTAQGSDTDTFPTVMNNILGTKLKLVTGYPGGNDINFAMERGEVDGRCGWSWSSVKSTRASWLKTGKINIIIQMSTAKHPDLPNVPFIMDLAKTEKDRKVLELVFARQAWGRPFLTTPNVPPARLAALRAAFDATMKDPKFLRDVTRQKLELVPMSGATIQDLIENVYASPKDIVQAAARATVYTGGIEITKAVIPVETTMGEITAIKSGGRSVSWSGGGKKGRLRVSGSKTKISVAGAESKRKALKVGMSCSFTYQGSAAKQIDCK